MNSGSHFASLFSFYFCLSGAAVRSTSRPFIFSFTSFNSLLVIASAVISWSYACFSSGVSFSSFFAVILTALVALVVGGLKLITFGFGIGGSMIGVEKGPGEIGTATFSELFFTTSLRFSGWLTGVRSQIRVIATTTAAANATANPSLKKLKVRFSGKTSILAGRAGGWSAVNLKVLSSFSSPSISESVPVLFQRYSSFITTPLCRAFGEAASFRDAGLPAPNR